MVSIITLCLTIPMTLESWVAVNDGVMGGVSSGRMVETGAGLRFEGELSLENNGGFASVRHLVEEDLGGTDTVRLQVRGDGRTYQVRLRQDGRFDGVAWRAEFDTTGEWQTVELRYSEFEPVFRGRKVPQAGPVIASMIRQIGFLLADKTPGAFQLEVQSIEFLAVASPDGN